MKGGKRINWKQTGMYIWLTPKPLKQKEPSVLNTIARLLNITRGESNDNFSIKKFNTKN